MDGEAFWKIIEASRERGGGDPDDQMEALRELLTPLSAEEVVSFAHHYEDLAGDAYRWDVWLAAYLAGGGCSDDGFTDFRGWLVAQGRKIYEAVLEDPEYLAEILEDGDEGQVEGFQYIAPEIWEAKTGLDRISDFPDSGRRQPKKPLGVRHPDGEFPERYPKLWAKFGHQF